MQCKKPQRRGTLNALAERADGDLHGELASIRQGRGRFAAKGKVGACSDAVLLATVVAFPRDWGAADLLLQPGIETNMGKLRVQLLDIHSFHRGDHAPFEGVGDLSGTERAEQNGDERLVSFVTSGDDAGNIAAFENVSIAGLATD